MVDLIKHDTKHFKNLNLYDPRGWKPHKQQPGLQLMPKLQPYIRGLYIHHHHKFQYIILCNVYRLNMCVYPFPYLFWIGTHNLVNLGTIFHQQESWHCLYLKFGSHFLTWNKWKSQTRSIVVSLGYQSDT